MGEVLFFSRMVSFFDRPGCRKLLRSLRRATEKRQLNDRGRLAMAADIEGQRCTDPGV
jgi:hypothetical protein